MNEESGYLIERKCANCGKIFCPAPEHVYKDDDKAFCKWSCLCEYRKHKEEAKEKRRVTNKRRRRYTRELRAEVIRMVADEHKTQKEVAEEFGLKYITVNSWMKAYREGTLNL